MNSADDETILPLLTATDADVKLRWESNDLRPPELTDVIEKQRRGKEKP